MADNNHFVCGAGDGALRICCVKVKKILKTMKIHRTSVTSVTQWGNYIISSDVSG